jgi:ethanolamine kinase
VLQKWISALPTETEKQKERKESLQDELEKLQNSTDEGGYGLQGQDGGVGLIMGHCDLLSGNVIIIPQKEGVAAAPDGVKTVHFIDYE